MIMAGVPRESVKLIKQNTDITANIEAAFFPSKILIDDASLEIVEGDIIERSLPSGVLERYVITDCLFCAGMGSIPSHYQLTVKKQTACNGDSVMQELKRIAQTLENAEEILTRIEAMEQNMGKKGLTQKYNDFLQSAANHMTVFGPFIPTLTQIITSSLK